MPHYDHALITPDTFTLQQFVINGGWGGLSPPSNPATPTRPDPDPAVAMIANPAHTTVIVIRNTAWGQLTAGPPPTYGAAGALVQNGAGVTELRFEASIDGAVNWVPITAVHGRTHREHWLVNVPPHPDASGTGAPFVNSDWFHEVFFIPGSDMFTHVRVRCRDLHTLVWVDITGTAGEGPAPIGPPARDTLMLQVIGATPTPAGAHLLLPLLVQRGAGTGAAVAANSYAVPLRTILRVHALDITYLQATSGYGKVDVHFKARPNGLPVTATSPQIVFPTALSKPVDGTQTVPSAGYASKHVKFDPPLEFLGGQSSPGPPSTPGTSVGFSAMTPTGQAPGQLWITAHCTEGP